VNLSQLLHLFHVERHDDRSSPRTALRSTVFAIKRLVYCFT
jgi:hypothetical protein